MGLSDISAADVNKAIEEFRELGRARFLAQYRYEDATRWELVVGGERFPSKAILGVAHNFARPILAGIAAPSRYSRRRTPQLTRNAPAAK